MKNLLFLFSIITLLFTSCIKDDINDDFVEPTIRITTTPDTIIVGSQFQFDFAYFNNVGQRENINPTWSSSNESLLMVDQSGLATAIVKGAVTITVSYTSAAVNTSESFEVNIGEVLVEVPTAKSGRIATTSSYVLEGDFEISEESGKLIISIAENYSASTSLPGLFVYLTNNISTTSNAYEIGAVETFSGAHTYEIDGIGINEYSHILYFCKPFNVKVGDGEIK
ncbi:MAG: hypothetical protein ACJA1A_002830 [Saprospiraceae bacterium]|jgi:hypothetical protein|tara:strand:- start:778 stop:1452 length:675 start_codon:yes stop_codon:yes gene_type:complete